MDILCSEFAFKFQCLVCSGGVYCATAHPAGFVWVSSLRLKSYDRAIASVCLTFLPLDGNFYRPASQGRAIHVPSVSLPCSQCGTCTGKIKLVATVAFMLLSINAGLLRSFGMVTGYGAPLRVYDALETPGIAQEGGFVCLGKEWYRFPSSFFLPQSMRAKFVRSEFSGLLPGEFDDSSNLQALLSGTSAIPSGMNDRNEEDPSKYTDISQCSFLVDSYFPSQPSTSLEPDYIHDSDNWEKLSCEKFLDASKTSILGRVSWIPDLPLIPDRFKRHWGEYCLLRRRDLSTKFPRATQ